MFRSERLVRVAAGAALLAAMFSSSVAAGDDKDTIARARSEFVTATEHVKNARWGEALASFERSAELRPHALTTFDIGACERALGRYTRARIMLEKALAANEAAGGKELAASFVNDAKTWISEIDHLVVRASISVRPADAALLIDGKPPEPGAIERGEGKLVLDPGSHVFSVSRAGFNNVVLTKTLTPGTTPDVVLDMQSLPATLHVGADRASAVVSIDEVDVGLVPAVVTRPAGTYAIMVRKPGYLTYQSRVKVGPGEEPTIQANMPEETTPVTKKAWFWTAAAVVVAGAAVGTYFLTRPAPERPAPNGGALGWVVTVPTNK